MALDCFSKKRKTHAFRYPFMISESANNQGKTGGVELIPGVLDCMYCVSVTESGDFHFVLFLVVCNVGRAHLVFASRQNLFYAFEIQCNKPHMWSGGSPSTSVRKKKLYLYSGTHV